MSDETPKIPVTEAEMVEFELETYVRQAKEHMDRAGECSLEAVEMFNQGAYGAASDQADLALSWFARSHASFKLAIEAAHRLKDSRKEN